MVEEALFKNLLMQSGTVETDGKGELNVVFKRFVARRSVDAIRIEALVEHQTLENRAAVDAELVAVQAHFAQTEITRDVIFTESECNVIQIAAADIPQMLFAQLYRECMRAAGVFCCVAAHFFAFKRSRCCEVCRTDQLCGHRHRACSDVRIILHAGNISLRGELQPYGLPNARGARVEAAV